MIYVGMQCDDVLVCVSTPAHFSRPLTIVITAKKPSPQRTHSTMNFNQANLTLMIFFADIATCT